MLIFTTTSTVLCVPPPDNVNRPLESEEERPFFLTGRTLPIIVLLRRRRCIKR